MRLDEFQYDLPSSLIAQTPVSPRDAARLMVVNRADHVIQDSHFYDLGTFLRPGDVLVFNNSKVIPARLFGSIAGTSRSKIETFLLRDRGQGMWDVLIKPGKKAPVGTRLEFDEGLVGTVMDKSAEGVFTLQFNIHPSTGSGSRPDGLDGQDFYKIINRIGETPLPPYITERTSHASDYQTVYAKPEGSVAAPTAGLHFTTELLARLTQQGIQQEFVTLHVGLGTFQPVKVENILEHTMHAECFTLEPDVAKRLNNAKAEGRRIIAVGTTACRVLESCATPSVGVQNFEPLHAKTGDTNIFIYPGYQFKFLDGLITNFHLPKSTLLMLVSALAGREFILEAYEHAKEKGYRFFSFGDGMLIL